jgi:p-aminobenzoyl-glutamate transporter AbgT
MHQTEHAQTMTDRFRELVEQSGDSLPDNHYDELMLIIEAGLDTALAEAMKSIADKLVDMAHDIRHNADFFD